jgi:hypothetical protein
LEKVGVVQSAKWAGIVILPTDLLPSVLGVVWGMSKEQCLKLLDVEPTWQSSYEGSALVQVTLPIQGKQYSVRLHFDSFEGMTVNHIYPGLLRIETQLYESQVFWNDEAIDGGPLWEALERVGDQYESYYDDLVRQYSAVLGTPEFFGCYGLQS